MNRKNLYGQERDSMEALDPTYPRNMYGGGAGQKYYAPGLSMKSTQAPSSYDKVSRYGDVIKRGMSLGTGFWVSTLIQLGGGLLSSIFARKPKPIRTPQEMYFEDMVNFYSGLGKKARMNRSMAAAITGKTTDDYKKVFPDDTETLMNRGV